MQEQRLIQFSLCKVGGYFLYLLPNVKRGIRGKSRGHADEIIAVGVPMKKLDQYMINHKYTIKDNYFYIDGVKTLKRYKHEYLVWEEIK